ncbi:MAG: hypothetical protein ACR2KT_05900 [Methylocella sp.]|nr:MAG: hypothetical protein DLM68_01290 [Hyphomicrobiales bacterium]
MLTTKTEQLQYVYHSYEAEHDHLPTSAREAVECGVREGLVELPLIDPYDVLAAEMAKALREEYAVDERGLKYRVNHAVRVTKAGVQYTFWATMGFAPRAHMEKAFAQRREQVVGDCLQLRIDVDAYNNLNKGEAPIQLVLDFADDVAERMSPPYDEAA